MRIRFDINMFSLEYRVRQYKERMERKIADYAQQHLPLEHQSYLVLQELTDEFGRNRRFWNTTRKDRAHMQSVVHFNDPDIRVDEADMAELRNSFTEREGPDAVRLNLRPLLEQLIKQFRSLDQYSDDEENSKNRLLLRFFVYIQAFAPIYCSRHQIDSVSSLNAHIQAQVSIQDGIESTQEEEPEAAQQQRVVHFADDLAWVLEHERDAMNLGSIRVQYETIQSSSSSPTPDKREKQLTLIDGCHSHVEATVDVKVGVLLLIERTFRYGENSRLKQLIETQLDAAQCAHRPNPSNNKYEFKCMRAAHLFIDSHFSPEERACIDLGEDGWNWLQNTGTQEGVGEEKDATRSNGIGSFFSSRRSPPEMNAGQQEGRKEEMKEEEEGEMLPSSSSRPVRGRREARARLDLKLVVAEYNTRLRAFISTPSSRAELVLFMEKFDEVLRRPSAKSLTKRSTLGVSTDPKARCILNLIHSYLIIESGVRGSRLSECIKNEFERTGKTILNEPSSDPIPFTQLTKDFIKNNKDDFKSFNKTPFYQHLISEHNFTDLDALQTTHSRRRVRKIYSCDV